MKSIKSFLKVLHPVDVLIIGYAIFLTIVNLIYIDRVDNWPTHIILNTLVIILVSILAYFDNKKDNIFLQQIHYWYIVPLIFLSFKEIYFMVKPIRGVDMDQILIEIDRFIFGTDPTVVLHNIANPVLTEILQIVYGTFFFLPIILAINLMVTDRDNAFQFTIFAVVLGFLLSYIGYFLVPAIGPRFTIHEFDATNSELPGIIYTNYLRDIVNAGESIPPGTPNPAEVVQRDVFPSGHTQMTLIVMFLSVKFKVFTRYFFIPIGTLLIFSTVYLRYHYVIDLIGGLVFMIATMYLSKALYNMWMQFTGGNKFEYGIKS
jgi:membrane-associated phospholipid phosphatase